MPQYVKITNSGKFVKQPEEKYVEPSQPKKDKTKTATKKTTAKKTAAKK